MRVTGSFNLPISGRVFTSGKGGDFSDGGHPTATGGVDYFETSRSFWFSQTGEMTINVPAYRDDIVESDEWFLMILAVNPPWSANPLVRTRGLIYDATVPTLSIDDVSVPEGDAGTTTAGFTVTLAPPASSTVTVDYSVRVV